MNRIIIDGRLAQAPEIKRLPSGTTVANFRIGSVQSSHETMWIDCEMYGERAEKIMVGLTKGSHVLLDAKLRQRQWEQDGERKTRFTLYVDMLYRMGTQNAEQSTEQKESTPF